MNAPVFVARGLARIVVLAPALAWIVVLAPALAGAQSAQRAADALFASKFAVDDADPSRTIPGVQERDAAPLDFTYFLMNLSEKAQAAEKSRDRAAQIRYLRAITAAVPDRSLGFSMLCAAYEANAQLVEAERSCAAAITLPGARLEDFARYVRIVFGQERDLEAAELANLDAVGKHLRREAADSPILIDVECQLAIRMQDEARYRGCTTSLGRLSDNDVKRLSYRWSWAMARHDYREAGVLIDRAKQSAMPSSLVERMIRARSAQLPWWQRLAEQFFDSPFRTALFAVVVAGLCGLIASSLLARRGTHKQPL